MKEQNEEWRKRLLSLESVREMISTRAYEIYLNRGGEHGRDLEDWLQAEKEVIASLTFDEPLAAAAEVASAGTRESTK